MELKALGQDGNHFDAIGVIDLGDLSATQSPGTLVLGHLPHGRSTVGKVVHARAQGFPYPQGAQDLLEMNAGGGFVCIGCINGGSSKQGLFQGLLTVHGLNAAISLKSCHGGAHPADG